MAKQFETLKKKVADEMKHYRFYQKDFVTFIAVAICCFTCGTFLLFFNSSDWFLVPSGVGVICLLFLVGVNFDG